MKYEEFAKTSREIWEKAKKSLPGGVSYSLRYFPPFPLYVTRASGAYVWDLDGNQYLDLWMGHGAVILGHNHPAIIDVAKEQLNYGIHFGYCSEWEVRWAEAVKSWFGVEMVRPTNSGTEANMYAIRLARAYTGRKKVAKFVGGWHGGYDPLMTGVHFPFRGIESAGIPEELCSNTVLLRYNDLECCEKRIREEELAAVLVEPVLGAGGVIPAEREFLKGLREVCEETGTVLIFDEVITGFRFFHGGTGYYGISPDLVTMGKAVGGQYFPGAGGIGGKKEIMELFDQVKYPEAPPRVFHGGTYTGNALTTRAGYTLIKILEREGERFYRSIEEKTRKMGEGLQELMEKYGVEGHVTLSQTMFGLHFTKELPKDAETSEKTKDKRLTQDFFKFMLDHKICYISPSKAHFFLSASHKDSDVDYFLKVAEDFFKEHKH